MATSEYIERTEAVVCDVFDHAPEGGRDTFEFAQEIIRALDKAGMLAPAPMRQEWAAVVGWRNEHGQTEQNRGYGGTREAALADARSQPRMMLAADEDEVAHKTVRRLATDWQEA